MCLSSPASPGTLTVKDLVHSLLPPGLVHCVWHVAAAQLKTVELDSPGCTSTFLGLSDGLRPRCELEELARLCQPSPWALSVTNTLQQAECPHGPRPWEFPAVSAETQLARERILKFSPNKVKGLAAVETAGEPLVREYSL